MAPPQRHDPYKTSHFVVEIDGIAAASFSEVSGLTSETEVIEYREGSDRDAVRKLPGLTKYANLVLKRGITQSAELWQWRRSVVDGAVQRRNGAVVLLGDDGSEAVRWTFAQGWICRWEGPTLRALANEVAIETIEIAHEGLDRV